MRAMMCDYEDGLDPWLYVDASAAIGVAQRTGLGKIRHLDTGSLWLQRAVKRKQIGILKIEGTENRIQIAVRDYNEAVREYNTRIRTFPDAIGAKLFYGAKPMTPYQAATPGAEVAPEEAI